MTALSVFGHPNSSADLSCTCDGLSPQDPGGPNPASGLQEESWQRTEPPAIRAAVSGEPNWNIIRNDMLKVRGNIRKCLIVIVCLS